MKMPLLLVNCKNYGTHELASEIALAAKAVVDERAAAGKREVTIALAVGATDIALLKGCGVPVFAEHVDEHKQGSCTGKVLPESVAAVGAAGSLVNHSEDQVSEDRIKAMVARLQEHELVSVVCAKDDVVAATVAAYGPSFIAMEPPELIGGDISVSTAQPDLIKKTVSAVKSVSDIPVLVGAGVKNAADVRVGVELGAVGILVASGVTKASDKKAAIAELASGFD